LNTVVTGLTAATSYTFTVRAKMQQFSGVSNSLTVTNSNTPQLIYVFGIYRRFFKNKALEISNKTNSAVNLLQHQKTKQWRWAWVQDYFIWNLEFW
jgi:hypothetical protein